MKNCPQPMEFGEGCLNRGESLAETSRMKKMS